MPNTSGTKQKMTVIVAVWNAASDLERTLTNILEQEDVDVEVVVVDGGSTDGTKTILVRHNSRLKWWVSEKDNGIYDAWNKALPHIGGDWVCFLGAGDTFVFPHTLKDIAGALEANGAKGIRIVYGRTYLVNHVGDKLQCYGQPWDEIKQTWMRSGFGLCHTGLFQHASLFRERQFDPSFRVAGDYDFLLAELNERDAVFVEMDVASWQIGGISVTPRHRLQCLKEFARARERNGLSPRNANWYVEYAKAIVRIALVKALGERAMRALTDFYRRMTGRPPIWSRSSV